MNLYHSFRNVSFGNNKQYWNKKVERFLKNPSDAEARKFITDTYAARGKLSAFNFGMQGVTDFCKKSTHTVSAFLLGLSLRPLVENTVQTQITCGTGKIFDFSYPWFLASLYHDTTAELEKRLDAIRPTLTPEILDLSSCMADILRKFDDRFKYDLYGNGLADTSMTFDCYTYLENTVYQYFKMRMNQNKFDHGIVAGMLLYDRLLRNYQETWECESKKNSLTPKRCFWTYDSEGKIDLLWRQEQLWIFGCVADAIVAHNIWHVDKGLNPDSAREYEANGLEMLAHCAHEDNGKITLREHPLAFFLGLIDSIEPVKYFDKINPQTLWDNIAIELSGNTIIISQSGTMLNFEKWYNDKMKEIPIWLSGVKVSPPKDNVIRIEVKR